MKTPKVIPEDTVDRELKHPVTKFLSKVSLQIGNAAEKCCKNFRALEPDKLNINYCGSFELVPKELHLNKTIDDLSPITESLKYIKKNQEVTNTMAHYYERPRSYDVKNYEPSPYLKWNIRNKQSININSSRNI